MSNLRSGKAIKNPVFEQGNNTLITIFSEGYTEFFSKIEEKYKALEDCLENEGEAVFIWMGANASNGHLLGADDMQRLIDNKE